MNKIWYGDKDHFSNKSIKRRQQIIFNCIITDYSEINYYFLAADIKLSTQKVQHVYHNSIK